MLARPRSTRGPTPPRSDACRETRCQEVRVSGRSRCHSACPGRAGSSRSTDRTSPGCEWQDRKATRVTIRRPGTVGLIVSAMSRNHIQRSFTGTRWPKLSVRSSARRCVSATSRTSTAPEAHIGQHRILALRDPLDPFDRSVLIEVERRAGDEGGIDSCRIDHPVGFPDEVAGGPFREGHGFRIGSGNRTCRVGPVGFGEGVAGGGRHPGDLGHRRRGHDHLPSPRIPRRPQGAFRAVDRGADQVGVILRLHLRRRARRCGSQRRRLPSRRPTHHLRSGQA